MTITHYLIGLPQKDRRFVVFIFLSIAGTFVLPQRSHANPRPNILFFLADDQRDDHLGCAGHPLLQTPHIDGLAQQGVRFKNAFVTTPICAASRASLLTGLYERTHGFTFLTPPLRKSFTHDSYPVLLRKHGYRLGFTGKIGVNLEVGHRALFDFFSPRNRTPYIRPQPDGSFKHETDLCGDDAIAFLQSQSSESPFCLSVWFNAPHAEDDDRRPGIGQYPWPSSVNGMYEDSEIPRRRLSDPAIFERQPSFLKSSFNRERYLWRWDTPEKYQVNLRAYYRMISGVDHAIGRVLQKLEQLGFAGNTIVIYAADNGYYLGERGFADKWSHYEESLRVPLIIYDPRSPNRKRDKVVEAPALNIDIAPTILDAAGIAVAPTYQGRSLLPLITNSKEARNANSWRDDFFCEHLMNLKEIPKWEGVRGNRYVYAHYFEHNFEFLHDLKSDPEELVNLASDSKYADALSTMRARTLELRARYKSP